MRELKYAEILKANNRLRKKVADAKPYHVMVLSNVTCNQLGATLAYQLMQQGVNPVIGFGNYDNVAQDSFNQQEQQLVIVHYELLNVVGKTDCYVEDLSDAQMDEITTSMEGELDLVLQNLAGVPCVLFDSFSAAAIAISPLRRNRYAELSDRLNRYVQENKAVNTYLIDAHAIYEKIGAREALDFKLYKLSMTLYTIDYWKEYTYLITPLLLKVTGKVKKAVIFDCDNTLWKGVLGEDGMDGIDMSEHSKVGSLYHQVQNMAVWLSKHGVLIGLCSKNNPEDVAEVIGKHKDMALRDEHIVVSEVNWSDKVSNLRAIAENLNIGLDSLVFVDDSDFEINLIKEQLPQVVCMQVPEAIYDYPSKLADIINTYFYFSNSKADLDKTNQYKQQAQRNQQKSKFADITDYLKSLEMEVTFGIDKAEEVERVAQLTQRTNQLNVCTNRYTQAQIEEIKKSDSRSYLSLSVKDRFGNSGLTGVAIVSYDGGKGVIVDFLMSCRVMGRNIEFAYVDFIVDYLKGKGCSAIKATYQPTQKNKPVADFFEKCGFPLVSEKEGKKVYSLNIGEYKYQNVEYIKVS